MVCPVIVGGPSSGHTQNPFGCATDNRSGVWRSSNGDDRATVAVSVQVGASGRGGTTVQAVSDTAGRYPHRIAAAGPRSVSACPTDAAYATLGSAHGPAALNVPLIVGAPPTGTSISHDRYAVPL